MATTTRKPPTETDLRETPRDGNKYELVDGEIRVSPGGGQHSGVSLRIAAREDVLPGFRSPLGDIV